MKANILIISIFILVSSAHANEKSTHVNNTEQPFYFEYDVSKTFSLIPSEKFNPDYSENTQLSKQSVDFFKSDKTTSDSTLYSPVNIHPDNTVNMSPYEKAQYYNQQQNMKGVVETVNQSYLDNLNRARDRGQISHQQYQQKYNERPVSTPTHQNQRLSFPISIDK